MPGAFRTELGNSIKDEAIINSIKATGIMDAVRPALDVAQAIKYALQQDPTVAINEMVIRPTAQVL